jgi:hypothetical protein
VSGRKRPDLGCAIAKRLREPPHRLYRSEVNEYAILVDRFATRKTDKALTILKDGETEIRSFTIADLLTAAEIEEQESRRNGQDWWFRGVGVDFAMDGNSVLLTTPHARRIEIGLRAG